MRTSNTGKVVGILNTTVVVERETQLKATDVGYSIGNIVDETILRAIAKKEKMIGIALTFTTEQWDMLVKDNGTEVEGLPSLFDQSYSAD